MPRLLDYRQVGPPSFFPEAAGLGMRCLPHESSQDDRKVMRVVYWIVSEVLSASVFPSARLKTINFV